MVKFANLYPGAAPLLQADSIGSLLERVTAAAEKAKAEGLVCQPAFPTAQTRAIGSGIHLRHLQSRRAVADIPPQHATAPGVMRNYPFSRWLGRMRSWG